MILYEYPFNERIRTYLRLSELFDRLGALQSRDAPIDHHFALITLFEVMEVATRPELKSDVLKDLERQKQIYTSYRGNPAISEKALDAVLSQLEDHFDALNSQPGRLGHGLGENEFLMAIRSRAVIPGGTCEFDLPAYHAWQHRSAEHRRSDLQRWIAPFAPLSQAILLLMQMLRESGMTQKVMATQGQLQQNLPQGRSFQLLRLRVDPSLDLIPEISCNRLVVVIRMMQASADGRLVAHAADVPFELTLCA